MVKMTVRALARGRSRTGKRRAVVATLSIIIPLAAAAPSTPAARLLPLLSKKVD